jgi:hypothetical protein
MTTGVADRALAQHAVQVARPLSGQELDDLLAVTTSSRLRQTEGTVS